MELIIEGKTEKQVKDKVMRDGKVQARQADNDYQLAVEEIEKQGGIDKIREELDLPPLIDRGHVDQEKVEDVQGDNEVKDEFADWKLPDGEEGYVHLLVENVSIDPTRTIGEYPNERPLRLSRPYVWTLNPIQYERKILNGVYKGLGLTIHKALHLPNECKPLPKNK